MNATGIDIIKKVSDFRITWICGTKYILTKTKEISGRWIEPRDNYYKVTESALKKLESKYIIVCDF